MSTKKTIYFAHSFNLRNTEKEREIQTILEKYWNVINPFDGEDELEKKYGYSYYEQPNSMFAQDIVGKDLDQIKQSDLLFAYIDQRQIGTMFEIAYTTFILKKYIIVICEQPSPFFLAFDNIHWYPSMEEFEKDYRWI